MDEDEDAYEDENRRIGATTATTADDIDDYCNNDGDDDDDDVDLLLSQSRFILLHSFSSTARPSCVI